MRAEPGSAQDHGAEPPSRIMTHDVGQPSNVPPGVAADIRTPRNEVAIEIVGLNKWFGAFHVLRELGQTAQGELLSLDALTAIHWTHRSFALVALAAVLFAAWRASSGFPRMAIAIAGLAVLQFSLGIANVAFSLPLALAAAHNAGAALLLLSLVVLNFFAFCGLRPSW